MFPNASDDMLLLNATSSQAPGTQLSFVCITEELPRNFDVITITCQVNGLWQPSIDDKHCQEFATVGKFRVTCYVFSLVITCMHLIFHTLNTCMQIIYTMTKINCHISEIGKLIGKWCIYMSCHSSEVRHLQRIGRRPWVQSLVATLVFFFTYFFSLPVGLLIHRWNEGSVLL